MDKPPTNQFGKRRPAGPARGSSPPVKRSNHVALLVMGTLAVGGTAYALMPKENCTPSSPGAAAPSTCSSRGSSSSGGYSGSRSGFYGGSGNSSTSSASGESARGGFGGFGRAFGGFSGS
jgi:hypothetical protein